MIMEVKEGRDYIHVATARKVRVHNTRLKKHGDPTDEYHIDHVLYDYAGVLPYKARKFMTISEFTDGRFIPAESPEAQLKQELRNKGYIPLMFHQTDIVKCAEDMGVELSEVRKQKVIEHLIKMYTPSMGINTGMIQQSIEHVTDECEAQ